jgi:hypothetical protein
MEERKMCQGLQITCHSVQAKHETESSIFNRLWIYAKGHTPSLAKSRACGTDVAMLMMLFLIRTQPRMQGIGMTK